MKRKGATPYCGAPYHAPLLQADNREIDCNHYRASSFQNVPQFVNSSDSEDARFVSFISDSARAIPDLLSSLTSQRPLYKEALPE